MLLGKRRNKLNGERKSHRDGEGLSLIPPTRCKSYPVDKKGQHKESYLSGCPPSGVLEMNGIVRGGEKRAQGTG